MKRKTLLIVLITLFFSISVFARGGFGGGRGEGLHHQRMIKDLNLNEAQIKKLQDMRTKSFPKMQEKRRQLRDLRNEFMNIMHSKEKGTAFEQKAREKFLAMENLKQELAKERFEHILFLKNLLNNEQLDAFKNMKHRFGRERKGRNGGQGKMRRNGSRMRRNGRRFDENFDGE